jgi:hypothetical protein
VFVHVVSGELVVAATVPAGTDGIVSSGPAVDDDRGGRALWTAGLAQCASVRMTFVRMIDSLMENWRSISLTSTGFALMVMTA